VAAPESTPTPGDSNDELLHRLLLVRCLRIDRITVAATAFVAGALGQRYVEAVHANFADLGARANAFTPVILVEPKVTEQKQQKLKELILEAATVRQASVSSTQLGGFASWAGASKALFRAIAGGGWVLLESGHHAVDDLSRLADWWVKAGAEAMHPSFRLWIITEATPSFPTSLLHLSLRFHHAPLSAVGVRADLKAAYEVIDQEMLDAFAHKQWKQVILLTVGSNSRSHLPCMAAGRPKPASSSVAWGTSLPHHALERPSFAGNQASGTLPSLTGAGPLFLDATGGLHARPAAQCTRRTTPPSDHGTCRPH
jgi:dynein heavy chain, axonemal